MLESYYDVEGKDSFDELFKGTWIYDHPTDEKNAHLVLSLNFSKVSHDPDMVEKSFNSYIKSSLRKFCGKYAQFLPEGIVSEMETMETASDMMRTMFDFCEGENVDIFLIIDEYDNFANTILSTVGQDAYHKLTHGVGFFRHFFSLFKGATSGAGSAVKRMFITGVSPVTMDDVTSGFNIGFNVSLSPVFNDVLGFREQDIDALLDEYRPALKGGKSTAEMKKLIKHWYDGYKFHKGAEGFIYNTDMVLYLLNNILTTGAFPELMLDRNIRIDYEKLKHLITIDQQTRLNGNFTLLNRLADEEQIASPVVDGFPLESVARKENFISLLVYFGLLTFSGKSEKGAPLLRIPNQTVRELFYSYIRDSYKDVSAFNMDLFDLNQAMRDGAYDGDFLPVFSLLSDQLQKQSAIRDYIEGESFVKGFLLAYLNVTDVVLSRSELEKSKGFADIVMSPFQIKYPDANYGCVIELKYLKRSEFSEKALDTAKNKAFSQLETYAKDPSLAPSLGINYQYIAVIFNGWELVLAQEYICK